MEEEGKRKDSKAEEVEFVDIKQMRPNVLKDGTTFRVWREEFERWSGLRVRGMQEVLRWLGGRKEWNSELEGMLKGNLEEYGLGGRRERSRPK